MSEGQAPIDWAALAELAEKADAVPGEGRHEMVCTSASWATTKTGKRMIKAAYRIDVGPDSGTQVWANQTLSPENNAAVSIFMRFLTAHGVDPRVCSHEQIVKLMVNARVSADIEHEEWQDIPRARLSNFAAAAAGQAAPASAAVAAAPAQTTTNTAAAVQAASSAPDLPDLATGDLFQ